MTKLFYICAVIACLQFAACRVARDTQSQQFDFQELVKQGEAAVSDLNKKLLEFAGVKSNEELGEKVQVQAKEYAEKMQGLTQQLTAEAAKADEAIQKIAAKVGSAVDELKTYTESHPDLQKVQQEFQTRLQTVLKDSEEFGKKLKEQGKDMSVDTEKILKDIFDNTIKAAEKVAHDVEAEIKKKE